MTAKAQAFADAFAEFSLRLGIDRETANKLSAAFVTLIEDAEKMDAKLDTIKSDLTIIKAK